MIDDFIQNIRKRGSYRNQIVHIEQIPSQKAVYRDLDRPLPDVIQNYLTNNKIRLYCHQAEAINKIRKGKNVIIVTPTASGKTLAFNLPIFETFYKDNKATALYLYPSKALTNDQLKVLGEIERQTGIDTKACIYDGDTPSHQRAKIRSNSRIVLSNPYGFHQYLPWHNKWRNFLQNLKFVIIDEAHVYRGVFGSNVAMLIRRLLRICEYYNSSPQLILSSATIANPIEHASKLTAKEFEVVSSDGAPKGKKTFMFWNPPFIDDKKIIRRSTHQETKDLMALNIHKKLQTLCFTSSRQMAELITRWTREELQKISPEYGKLITAYRAGYLPQERRKIENELKTKKLFGVVSTNALELGIDIGSLDSVIISGYPGTIISTWQQAGRAGRSNSKSLVTLVAFANPLDQYYMKNPQDFFGKPHEEAIIDLHNRYISLSHIMCAAAELPLKKSDEKYFPQLFQESVGVLENQHLIQKTTRGCVYSGTARPTQVVSLNDISGTSVSVICNGSLLETLALTKAYQEVHEGAVLLHQGETYISEELNLNTLTAKVKQEDVGYYTEALKDIDVEIKKTFEKKLNGAVIEIGELEITERYREYVIKTYDEVLDRNPLSLPPLKFSTVGFWFIIPNEIQDEIKSKGFDFQGGIHAIEHAMIAMSPIFAMCDRRDIGGFSTVFHPDTKSPTIFIYDGFEGGIGISEKLYEKIQELWEKTYYLIKNCECKEGCPSCIFSPKCGNENEPLDKRVAINILSSILKLTALH